MLLNVVIPVRDEATTIAEVIQRVRAAQLPPDWQLGLIVVDDGSRDETPKIIAAHCGPDLLCLRHSSPQGKGAAVRTGFSSCTGDVVIIQDADLEYDPNDYGQMLQLMRDDAVQVVYGNRFKDGRPRGMSWMYYWGNRLLTRAANWLYESSLSDMETCYKALRLPVVQALKLTANGFEIEPEITAQILSLGIPIHEVPVSYNARSRRQGKKIRISDGWRALQVLWQLRT